MVKTKNDSEKVQFELRNEEYDSNDLNESDEEVEQMTPIVRRSKQVRKLVEWYSPLDFHFAFVLTATNEEPKSIKEVVESIEDRL